MNGFRVLFSLAVIVFCIYLFYKQIQFIIVSVNLYKEMVKQNSTMIEILLDIRDQTKKYKKTESNEELNDELKVNNSLIDSMKRSETNIIDKDDYTEKPYEFCYHCGYELKKKVKTCPNCGKEL